MKDLPEKLGERIRRFRITARMSQGSLALASHIAKSYLSDVERGKVNISIANLDKIAEALHIPLSLLLDWDEAVNRTDMLKALGALPDDALRAMYRLGMMIGRRRTRVPESGGGGRASR